jgi:DNA repair protein RadD
VILRPYQVRALDEVRLRYMQGHRSIVLVSPTGSGKTLLGALACYHLVKRGRRVLWLAHRRELIEQTSRTLRLHGVDHGVVAPWARRNYHPMQVGSIQTVAARDRVRGYDAVVVDECHHAFLGWYELVNNFRLRGRLILGLTATPQRADGTALGNTYSAMVVVAQVAQLVAQAHLVPSRMVALRGPTAAQAYLELCQGRPTIVFCRSVAHAQDTASLLAGAGVRAAAVDGGMTTEDRATALAHFGTGRLSVLTNMHVLTEGFDCPPASAVILARRFSSPLAFLQAVGRGLRPYPGKRDCLVVDLCGSVHIHGLPDEPRVYSLRGKPIARLANEPVRVCAACGTVVPARGPRVCPACGAGLSAEHSVNTEFSERSGAN